MGKEVKIICDQCGFDLTYTSNCEDYRLVLTYESKSPWYFREGRRGGALTMMAIEPPVDRAHYFCGIPCMTVWLSKREPNAVEEYDQLMKHRTLFNPKTEG